MKRRFPLPSVPVLGMLVLAASLPFAGCDEFELTMRPIADTVEVFSLARPELIGERSAFDFWNGVPRVLETAANRPVDVQNFDMAFSEIDGGFVALPAGVFATLDITPGLQRAGAGVTFDELVEAPRDGYTTDEPVPLEEGDLFVVQTRTVNNTCTRYAKFEVLELDPADGSIVFEFFVNDRCNDRLITFED